MSCESNKKVRWEYSADTINENGDMIASVDGDVYARTEKDALNRALADFIKKDGVEYDPDKHHINVRPWKRSGN